MESPPIQLPDNARIPIWVLVVVPLLAAALSNADVLFLAAARPRIDQSELAVTLATTIPLSLGASGLTLGYLLRLRREVDRRSDAEREAQLALKDLGLALDRERMLRRELNHRVRNNLSALLGLVSIYEVGEATSADIVQSLRGKIISLREAYGLIAATHGEGIELADLLRAVVSALLSGDRVGVVSVDGPSVKLTSREANAYAMIVQELLTNAAKHGALQQGAGTIRIAWQSAIIGNEARVALRWIEHPVAPASPPIPGQRSGLGLTLIRGLAESDLRGSVSFAREGDRWTVDLVANLKIPSLTAIEDRKHEEVHP